MNETVGCYLEHARHRSLTRPLLIAATWLSVAACSSWEPAICESGRICPPGMACAANQDICIGDRCANGITDQEDGESCDDGNRISGDGCSEDCKVEGCGNGIVDRANGEMCDDGNQVSGDGCNDHCKSEFCGNGKIDADFGEACDDGNRQSGDGCSSDCMSAETCGNGVTDRAAGEACDDGNPASGDGCNSKCESELCGNGTVDKDVGEVCDDGNHDSGDGCSPLCHSTEICGDGILNPEVQETCDDGNTLSGDGCSADCKSMEICGNGVVDEIAAELCDDGNNMSGDGCGPTCLPEACGNDFRDPGEQCDDGGTIPGDGCGPTCTLEVCGNGRLDPGEQCDDGDATAGGGCGPTCLREECGNDFRDPGEQCDDGNTVTGDGCGASCLIEICGNDVVDPDEQCDDGNTVAGDGCGPTCLREECGNGSVDPGEQCDNGDAAPGDGCGPACLLEVCGNGYQDPEEQCDDGNAASGDNCGPTCLLEECGNAFLDPGEQCDDGNLVAGDRCSQACLLEVCGNEFQDPGEQCDDGNHLSGDGCSPDCSSDETCGNGVVDQVAGEICDDSNGTSGDGCSADCRSDESCGNGIVDVDEECDDGNAINTDECTEICQPPSCTDGLQSGDESDVDCGGHCGPASCEMLQSCSTTADCTGTGVCVGATCVPDQSRLVTGEAHACALLDTGEVRCWGHGEGGRLGYGNTEDIGDNEDPASAGDIYMRGSIIRLVAGSFHTCALLERGRVRCWGWGEHGRLGYGNTQSIGNNEAPSSAGDVNVGGTVVQLAAGGGHTCVLLDTGTVRCWGWGDYGQLGYGNREDIGDNEDPASAGDVNVGGTVVQLAAGQYHTCALLDSGAVRCWGWPAGLGYGNTQSIGDNEDPASAGDVNVGGTVVQLAAGRHHTCALLDSGAVRCWGWGDDGQLGYGNTENIGNDEDPASAGDVSVGGTAVQLAAGEDHTCALLDSGAVRCWGRAEYGQLGYGNSENIGDNEDPASAGDVNVGGTVVQLAAGDYHTCALLDSGTVRCWGYGTLGRLGYGNTRNIGDNEDPASAGDVDVGGTVVQLTAGFWHTCALLGTGAVRCWGRAEYGQLGYGNSENIGDNEDPASAGDADVVIGPVAQLVAGRYHNCALLDSGAVRCWGSAPYGQLGYGNTENIGDNEDPASAGDVNVGGTVVQLDAGEDHTCALLDSGAVRCWGLAPHGQLGYGNTENIGDNEDPALAGDVNVGGTVVQLAAGRYHNCALLDAGAVRCWGLGSTGQLGYGNTENIGDNEDPASAGDVNVGGTVVQLTAGRYHICALLDTGAVRCWGYGAYGRLGYGNTQSIGNNEAPSSAGDVNVGGPVVQLAAGEDHTCALLASGTVRCWGSGEYGQLGYGNTENIGDNEDPAAAGDVNVGGTAVQISVGAYYTCALLDTGAVRCWGRAEYGQLGYGNTQTIGDDETPASAGDVNVGGSLLLRITSFQQTHVPVDSSEAQCWSDEFSAPFASSDLASSGIGELATSSSDISPV